MIDSIASLTTFPTYTLIVSNKLQEFILFIRIIEKTPQKFSYGVPFICIVKI